MRIGLKSPGQTRLDVCGNKLLSRENRLSMFKHQKFLACLRPGEKRVVWTISPIVGNK
jgi:hypothetical protein